ncbi:MAG: GNAT family N-acetyltransferase [Bacilli bacterium]|nr:GNAT family N-acetyltransferase [Bacilli bacterium]
MKDVKIEEVSLEEALKVHPKIDEWDRPEAGTVEYCSNRIGKSKSIILGAYVNNEIIGYLIAYENVTSFYCWLAAVDKRYRRMGILTEMMNIFESRAKELGYNKVTLKTLNNKREILSYLIKNNWNFSNIIENDNIILNEIVVEKEL